MTIPKYIGIAVAGTAGLSVAAVWIWRSVVRWRRKSPDEIERLRRLAVNACGRISPGLILELVETVPDGPAGPVILYEYEVAGVTYETAQDLSALPEIAAVARFLPGQISSIKYDPRQPTNSIFACESWCGISHLELLRKGSSTPIQETVGESVREIAGELAQPDAAQNPTIPISVLPGEPSPKGNS